MAGLRAGDRNGVVGHSAIANAARDGYAVGAVTVEIAMMRHTGLTGLSFEDVAPIALVDIVPASATARTDGRSDTLAGLSDHVEANPAALTASGTARSGIWHPARAGLLDPARLVVAAGVSGRGLAICRVTAALIADLVTGAVHRR
ncbi:MAG: hypothetical protein ACLFTL_04505, partial [Alphaproteobacteria bacterium]